MPLPTLLATALVVCLAADTPDDIRAKQAQDLKKLTLEELTQIEVTSVSRHPEPVSRTPAAVSVVRGEDLRRSGYMTLADALRLADAIDVAQVNGNTWGISTRGFNSSSANKLLVLVDGRSTYVPLFGGTFWDAQDMFVSDLDRIEVIRGPGGTIWGANAVNGVVNIISKPSAETQGWLVNLVAGTNATAVASARYGGRAGNHSYRVYGKFRHLGAQLLAAGGSAQDELTFGQGGFRLDSAPGSPTRWFLSGHAYSGTIGLLNRDEAEIDGGNLLGRLVRATRGNGEFELQAYYDHASRLIPLQFDSDRNTGEIDAQQTLRAGKHRLVFGSTWRVSHASDHGQAGFVFDPEERTSWTINAFIQDEYELLPGRAYVTAGTKVGRNNFTGMEFQPNVRLRIQHEDTQMFWAAVSRAIRLPTRFDTDLRLVNPTTRQVILTGTEGFDRETVVAYEGGYRALPDPRVSLDVAVFANRYDDLRSQELRFQPGPVVLLENALNATTTGVELAVGLQPMARWRLRSTYTWFHSSFSLDAGSTDPTRALFEAQDPAHQFSIRSWLDLPRRLSFDAVLRYVSHRPGQTPASSGVAAYAELDTRIGWEVNERLDLSLIGRNLLHASHGEMLFGGAPEEFRRAIMVRTQWRF